MERDENGFSVLLPKECCGEGDYSCGEQNGCPRAQLAMVYSPMQCFRLLYSPEKALMQGTMFEELDKSLEEI